MAAENTVPEQTSVEIADNWEEVYQKTPFFQRPAVWGLGGLLLGAMGCAAVFLSMPAKVVEVKVPVAVESPKSDAPKVAQNGPVEPFDPFAGTTPGLIPTLPPGAKLNGRVFKDPPRSAAPDTSSSRSQGGTATNQPSEPQSKKSNEMATLVSVNQSAGDSAAVADRIINLVNSSGGQVRQLIGAENGGVSQLTVVVPTDKVAKIVGAAKGGGASASTQKLTGADVVKDRQDDVDKLTLQLTKLKKDREELLVKYLDDAPSVKDIDEKIAQATKELEQISAKVDPKMTLIKITFSNPEVTLPAEDEG